MVSSSLSVPNWHLFQWNLDSSVSGYTGIAVAVTESLNSFACRLTSRARLRPTPYTKQSGGKLAGSERTLGWADFRDLPIEARYRVQSEAVVSSLSFLCLCLRVGDEIQPSRISYRSIPVAVNAPVPACNALSPLGPAPKASRNCRIVNAPKLLDYATLTFIPLSNI